MISLGFFQLMIREYVKLKAPFQTKPFNRQDLRIFIAIKLLFLALSPKITTADGIYSFRQLFSV